MLGGIYSKLLLQELMTANLLGQERVVDLSIGLLKGTLDGQRIFK